MRCALFVRFAVIVFFSTLVLYSCKKKEDDSGSGGKEITVDIVRKGTITGKVYKQGIENNKFGYVPCVGIALTLEGTSYSATTASDGSYVFGGIPERSYNITVIEEGYLSKTIGVQSIYNQTTQAPDIKLEIGGQYGRKCIVYGTLYLNSTTIYPVVELMMEGGVKEWTTTSSDGSYGFIFDMPRGRTSVEVDFWDYKNGHRFKHKSGEPAQGPYFFNLERNKIYNYDLT